MSQAVSYTLEDIATITLDDGKVNALSSTAQEQLHTALDRAERDGVPVVLAGRPGVFSAGFDLKVLRGGDSNAAAAMVLGGFRLAERLLSFPAPVVTACTGHAVAMGLFLMLSTDYRVGAEGAFRLTANEVAIGLTMPRSAIAVLRARLSPAAFDRAVGLAAPFDSTEAVAAGILDEVIAEPAVLARAREVARTTLGLDRAAHTASKLRARAVVLDDLRTALVADGAEFSLRAAS